MSLPKTWPRMWPTLKLHKILLIVTLDKTLAGVGLDAGGEFLDAFNNLVLIAILIRGLHRLGRLAQDMIALSGDFKTQEYQEASARINETIGNANLNEDGTLKTNPDGTRYPPLRRRGTRSKLLVLLLGQTPVYLHPSM